MLPTLFLPPQRPLLPEEWRHGIQALEAAMRALPGHVEGSGDHCPLRHGFAQGLCAREMFLPPGMLVVGRIHKQSHLSFLMLGKLLVIDEFSGRQYREAPDWWVSERGVKRGLYALEASALLCVFATDCTDIEALEDELTVARYEDLLIGEEP